MFLQLGGTTIVLHLHAIPNIQPLLESDPWWWSYDALKLWVSQFCDVPGGSSAEVAHRMWGHGKLGDWSGKKFREIRLKLEWLRTLSLQYSISLTLFN
jgi:hypothetical protein